MPPYHLPGGILGLINADGMGWLQEAARGCTSAVDVGCYQGGSTYLLCETVQGPVHAVDHWQGSPDKDDATHFASKQQDIHKIFLQNVGHFANLVVHKQNSPDAAAEFADRSVDLICIDAGHDAASVSADIAAWFPKCRRIFCGHDWSHVPVAAAVKSLGRPIETHPGDMWSVRCDD